ncbi:hypothetical protein DPMN_010043 [Dreissena polymorpha]|uniref:Uncharacterized protein n=1 Tax=Dreissena polymorpha TaxID=45954 RepID=A0A9D4MY26_DREPO|nr:hypothetical protein DPMN_010043 [Dreissena polymorpha]
MTMCLFFQNTIIPQICVFNFSLNTDWVSFKLSQFTRVLKVSDTAFQVHDISRKDGGTDVTAVYTVENKGGIVQPASAVDALSLLDSQELAIILGQVVASKAESKKNKQIR